MKTGHILDDMAAMAGGVMGSAMEAKREAERAMKAQAEKLLAGLNLVTREEFDAVQSMLAKAREEQEKMQERLTALERHIDGLEGKKGL
jgi:BMFP domain-containing protein YqiC